MRTIQTFVTHTTTDLRYGQETWRVRAIVLLYGIAGAAISVLVTAGDL